MGTYVPRQCSPVNMGQPPCWPPVLTSHYPAGTSEDLVTTFPFASFPTTRPLIYMLWYHVEQEQGKM